MNASVPSVQEKEKGKMQSKQSDCARQDFVAQHKRLSPSPESSPRAGCFPQRSRHASELDSAAASDHGCCA